MIIYSIRGKVIRKKPGKKPKEFILGFTRSEVQVRKAIKHLKEYGDPDRIDITSLHYEKEEFASDKDGFIEWLMQFCPDVSNVKELIQEVLEEE